MAVTALLQRSTPFKLIYVLSSDVAGGSVTITASGAATPDLVTDTATVQGPIKKIARAGLDGLGLIPAGGFNLQAETDALFFDQDPADVLGNDRVPRAITWCQGQSGDNDWIVRSTNGAGLPELMVTHPAAIAGGYLIIMASHSLWR